MLDYERIIIYFGCGIIILKGLKKDISKFNVSDFFSCCEVGFIIGFVICSLFEYMFINSLIIDEHDTFTFCCALFLAISGGFVFVAYVYSTIKNIINCIGYYRRKRRISMYKFELPA